MATDNGTSYVFAGRAGDTSPGIEWVEKHMGIKLVVKSGLYRSVFGQGDWQPLTQGLPDAPEIRAITIHPQRSEVVYVATQDGPYRSDDHGDHWEKVAVPDHGLPMWSLLFHPADPQIMFAGYESAEIYRSDDAGESWCQLPVSVRFPDVTMPPQGIPAKRVLMMSGSVADRDELYASLEVGGLLRSLDGGEHWQNLSHGQYLTDDTVDMHGVLASRLSPGTVTAICRVGMFRSTDRGDHWQRVPIEPLNDHGTTYCRCLREVPGAPTKLWLSGGGDFESKVGGLFHSEDGGLSWERVDIGHAVNSTLFAMSIDQRRTERMVCASKKGQVFTSADAGATWRAQALPADADQVYCVATG